MKAKARAAAKLAAVGTLTIALAVFAAPSAMAAGGVGIQAYCTNTYPGASAQAILVTQNAYGWRCKLNWHNNSEVVGVSVANACIQQHGMKSRAYLINNDSTSPYNWRCT